MLTQLGSIDFQEYSFFTRFLHHRFTCFPFRLSEPQPASVRNVHDCDLVAVTPFLALITPEFSLMYFGEPVLLESLPAYRTDLGSTSGFAFSQLNYRDSLPCSLVLYLSFDFVQWYGVHPGPEIFPLKVALSEEFSQSINVFENDRRLNFLSL
jgi:hypothetical protein